MNPLYFAIQWQKVCPVHTADCGFLERNVIPAGGDKEPTDPAFHVGGLCGYGPG
jgi:hypothetical protein